MGTIDELKVYGLRDASKLTPGTEVIFGHVPVLGQPDLDSAPVGSYGFFGTILEVKVQTFKDLHGGEFFEGDEPKLVIFYEDADGRARHIYASDSGVIPYIEGNDQSYNDTNFLVLTAELEAQGKRALLTATEDYARALQEHNDEIVYSDDSDEY